MSEVKKEKRKRGKPGKYDEYVKPYLSLISEWCNTMTDKQICEKLGVGYSTWMQYKIDYPELKDAIKKGRQNLVADLRSCLIKKAKGFEYTETKVTREAVELPKEMVLTLIDSGFTREQIECARIVKTEIATKKAHPDVAALNLALKNYDKDNWANDPQALDIRKRELALREKVVENNEW